MNLFSSSAFDDSPSHNSNNINENDYHHFTLLSERALSSSVNTATLLTPYQAETIQIVSCVFCGISFFAALVTFVWFLRMTRTFRHNLIFILITADVSRSFWLLIFCLVSLTAGQPSSASGFCQVTGFFYGASVELADLAVLTIAIHTALQIFRPNIGHVGNRGDESGLYRFRKWIYVIGAILPFIMASLAFVNGLPAYRSQGPYCSLPVRPFWFRLGLSWIPRYCILLTILGLYIAIYVHVALQFRTISWLRKLPGAPKVAPDMTEPAQLSGDGSNERTSHPLHTLNLFSIRQNSRSSTPGDSFQFPRRISRVSSSGTTLIGSTRGHAEKIVDHELHELSPFEPVREMSIASDQFSNDGPADFITSAISPPTTPTPSKTTAQANLTTSTQSDQLPTGKQSLEQAQPRKEMRKRHAAIQHKVRTLFIYPMVYFIMWLFPFANHAVNYSNYWAQHPIYWLVLLNFICISTMGSVDCLVFSLRERPWKSIEDSDGSFWGSFQIWRREPGRRGSANSGDSTSADSETAFDLDQTYSARHLGSIAEGDIEHDAGAYSPTSTRTGPLSNRQAGRVHGHDSWDFATDGGRSNNSTHPPKERHWFDRRLSIAVGRSVQPSIFEQS